MVCREVPEAGVLARVQAKAAELSSNSLLADAAREGVDYRQGLNSLPEASGTQTAASDWFKVCSMCGVHAPSNSWSSFVRPLAHKLPLLTGPCLICGLHATLILFACWLSNVTFLSCLVRLVDWATQF